MKSHLPPGLISLGELLTDLGNAAVSTHSEPSQEILSNVVFQSCSSCSVAPDAVFELHAVDYFSEQLVAV
jgi:hypothetical protein